MLQMSNLWLHTFYFYLKVFTVFNLICNGVVERNLLYLVLWGKYDRIAFLIFVDDGKLFVVLEASCFLCSYCLQFQSIIKSLLHLTFYILCLKFGRKSRNKIIEIIKLLTPVEFLLFSLYLSFKFLFLKI